MKKIFLTAAVAFIAASGFSQERAIKNYGFGDNWFLQGQVGASYTFSEFHKETSFGKLLTPHVAISVGKFFSPIAGARLQVGGWESKSYSPLRNNTYKYNYLQTSLDGLLNLTNVFSKYQGDRPFNLYGILGLAYVHNFKEGDYNVPTQNSIVPRVGLQGDFRLTNDLSLNLEATGNLMNDNFNGIVGDAKNDGTLNVLLGLTYRFNKGGFQLLDVADPEELASLNNMINKQRTDLNVKDREIERLRDDLSKKPQVIEAIKEDHEVLMNAVVVFKIGSAKLEQNQDINIYNAAKYLQDNPKVNITVTGYADKSTGNATINQRLSEQRAKAVADILTNKFGISKNRITVRASGDKEQPFQIDAWNRVVIFTAE